MLALAVAVACTPSAWAQPEPSTEQELQAQGARRIAAAELRTRLTGNTAYTLFLRSIGSVSAGTVVRTYYRDGKTRVVGRLVRIWWLEGDKLRHERSDKSAHTCYQVLELAGQLHTCADDSGTCDHVVRVVPGNPEGL